MTCLQGSWRCLEKAIQSLDTVDVNALVLESHTSDAQGACGAPHSGRGEIGPELPAVLGSREQLREVLLNLIANAIEAMMPMKSQHTTAQHSDGASRPRFDRNFIGRHGARNFNRRGCRTFSMRSLQRKPREPDWGLGSAR